MKLTEKLLTYLHGVFDKRPHGALALLLSYDGVMTWSVADGRLTTSVSGGSGVAIDVALDDYLTMGALAAFLDARVGYACTAITPAASPRALIDTTGTPAQSNGDHLYAYTSVLWSFLEMFSGPLIEAKLQIEEMFKQMSVRTASDEWLDELGSFYFVAREPGESDALYGPRIIAEVLLPKGNNIAIAEAIRIATGYPATVTDAHEAEAGVWRFNGTVLHDGSHQYSAVGTSDNYGLFDVDFAVDFESPFAFDSTVEWTNRLTNKLRDAGTHMRTIRATTGISDSDATTESIDSLAFSAVEGVTYNGSWRFNGSRNHSGTHSYPAESI